MGAGAASKAGASCTLTSPAPARGPTPPAGVEAERFAIDGVEFVAFSWGTPATSPDVTAAESAVLALVLDGASNADIARARGVSTRTVANQVASLLRKLGAGSRYELVARRTGSSSG